MRPEGPKIEAEGREWGGVLGEGAASLSPLDKGCELYERCELPSGVRGGTPTVQRFSIIFST